MSAISFEEKKFLSKVLGVSAILAESGGEPHLQSISFGFVHIGVPRDEAQITLGERIAQAVSTNTTDIKWIETRNHLGLDEAFQSEGFAPRFILKFDSIYSGEPVHISEREILFPGLQQLASKPELKKQAWAVLRVIISNPT